MSKIFSKTPRKISQPDSHRTQNQENTHITGILGDVSLNEDRIKFCHLILRETLISLIQSKYSCFDAHTTTNCCHGVALLARDLIFFAHQFDLNDLLKQTEEKINNSPLVPDWTLPKPLVELCQLFILNYILDPDISRGIRTVSYRLNSIVKLGYNFFEKLCKNLQKKYANLVALKWEHHAKHLKDINVSGAAVGLWGKYISHQHLRTSKTTYYASCLYSSQISLAYLSFSKAIIAIINDIYDDSGEFQSKFVQLLIGDGNGEFYPVKLEKFKDPRFLNEPVIVFGGCAFNNDPTFVHSEMEKWLEFFPQLMLAGEIFYPQFPKVSNDPCFNNAPIFPEEDALKTIIENYRNVRGVTIDDPSLYLSNHIFPCSIKQILNKDNLTSFAGLLPILRQRQQMASSQ